MISIVITYIWFGLTIPEQYLIKLSNVNYPVQILINPQINLPNQIQSQNVYDIQKADLYRLQYVKNGGIYSDFDNIINYTCLMKQIQNFDGEMMLMDFQWQGKINNNFIYVPFNRTKLVNEILENQTKKNCEKTDATCFGPQMYWKYRDRITIKPLYHCIEHTFDWSWWKQSNAANKRNTKPSKTISTIQIKKQQYIKLASTYLQQRNFLLIFISILGVGLIVLLANQICRKNKIEKQQCQNSQSFAQDDQIDKN